MHLIITCNMHRLPPTGAASEGTAVSTAAATDVHVRIAIQGVLKLARQAEMGPCADKLAEALALAGGPYKAPQAQRDTPPQAQRGTPPQAQRDTPPRR